MIELTDFKMKQFVFVFSSEGEKISFSNDNLVVKDINNKIKFQITCYRLFLVFIIGHVSITDALIMQAQKFGFSIILMTNTFKYIESISFKMQGNTLLRKNQYEYDSLEIGRKIIKNKVSNQLYCLKKIRNKSNILKDEINQLKKHVDALDNENLELQQILGIEGSAARVYFKNLYEDYGWKGRKPRIKSDYINSTLDIGYTILFNLIDALLGIYGFDNYYGVLHKCFYMRKSLVCDVMEPFRPLIDVQVRKALALKQCKEEHFKIYNGRYLLKWEKNKEYISFLMKPLLDNKNEIFLYIQSYYRAFMKKKNYSQFPMFNMEEK